MVVADWLAWGDVESAPDLGECGLSRSTGPSSRSTFRVKITGLYPRLRVDTSATAAIGQAGGVLLTRTVTATGLDRHLSAGLARWRKPLAVHDPGKIITDLALSRAAVWRVRMRSCCSFSYTHLTLPTKR